ncbi:DMT family transporter [Flammeovirgaceae bacterium KN852]|uniref:DMT family transporter n=2 Tax=Marinigracilibium pacificum TaxID=2729599 RepID=A0A848IXI5_9BACT|nr:DMT family transporter [Marinigracilibium pacificum]
MYFSRGVRFMLISGICFSLMNVLVKYLTNIPATEIIVFRSLISFVLSALILYRKKVSVWGNNKKLLIGRGLSGAIALTIYFYTLQRIPLATAVTLQFLAPVFTAILGIFIVKEKLNPWQFLFFVISFAGILIIKGFDERISTELVVLGVLSAFFAGLAYNIVRKLNTSEHPLVIVFYFPLVTLPLVSVYSAFNWVTPQGIEWLLLLGVGILTQIAQYYMTRAYQEESISKVAGLKYLGIIYGLGFGYLIFDETFNFYTYIGMAVVLVGVILNVWYKTWIDKKKLATQN